jgi:hypothetical protein
MWLSCAEHHVQKQYFLSFLSFALQSTERAPKQLNSQFDVSVGTELSEVLLIFFFWPCRYFCVTNRKIIIQFDYNQGYVTKAMEVRIHGSGSLLQKF